MLLHLLSRIWIMPLLWWELTRLSKLEVLEGQMKPLKGGRVCRAHHFRGGATSPMAMVVPHQIGEEGRHVNLPLGEGRRLLIPLEQGSKTGLQGVENVQPAT